MHDMELGRLKSADPLIKNTFKNNFCGVFSFTEERLESGKESVSSSENEREVFHYLVKTKKK